MFFWSTHLAMPLGDTPECAFHLLSRLADYSVEPCLRIGKWLALGCFVDDAVLESIVQEVFAVACTAVSLEPFARPSWMIIGEQGDNYIIERGNGRFIKRLSNRNTSISRLFDEAFMSGLLKYFLGETLYKLQALFLQLLVFIFFKYKVKRTFSRSGLFFFPSISNDI